MVDLYVSHNPILEHSSPEVMKHLPHRSCKNGYFAFFCPLLLFFLGLLLALHPVFMHCVLPYEVEGVDIVSILPINTVKKICLFVQKIDF